jgi:hypothetical protein
MTHGGRGAPTLASLLARSTLSAVVLCSFLAMSLLYGSGRMAASSEGRHNGGSPWKESWSARYPGCVSVLLWPQDERPVALVARFPDGRVTRVPVHRGQGLSAVPSGTRTVGACR